MVSIGQGSETPLIPENSQAKVADSAAKKKKAAGPVEKVETVQKQKAAADTADTVESLTAALKTLKISDAIKHELLLDTNSKGTQVFAEFLRKKAKGYPKLEQLYLNTGVCYGSCLDYVAKRIKGAPLETLLWPTHRGRFYQAIGNISIGEINSFFFKKEGIQVEVLQKPQLPIEDFLKQFDTIAKKLQQSGAEHILLRCVEQKTTTKSAISHSKIAQKVYRMLAQISRLPVSDTSPPKVSYEALMSLSKENLTDNISIFRKNILRLLSKILAGERAGNDSPSAIITREQAKITTKIEKLLGDLEAGLKKKETTSIGLDHVIYIHFESPYQIRDVNYPDFTRFTTNDFEEFKRHLAFWFIFNPEYTHVTEISKVSKKT